MGFGIALLGYACLMLNEIGGALIAAPLLAYGFFLASRLNKDFLKAAASALLMIPRGVVIGLSAFGVFKLQDFPALNAITFYIHLAAWLALTYFWLSTVMKIARDCNSPKLESQARNRLVFTVAFITLVMGAEALKYLNALGNMSGAVAGIEYILQYAVIIVNTLFMHTCFILITSERQYEKDKEQIAKDRAKALEKRMKEQKEEAERIARRRKK